MIRLKKKNGLKSKRVLAGSPNYDSQWPNRIADQIKMIFSTKNKSTMDMAIKELAKGGLVAIPTETVYGLAGDATNGIAVAKIFETKQRPAFNPLICHVSDLKMAKRYAEFDPVSARLAEVFWPGPLTLVVPLKSNHIHDLVCAGLDSVAMRAPTGFAQTLIKNYGQPLAAPSANKSGRISPTTAGHVAGDFGDRLTIIDGGPCRVGLESTIIKVEPDHIRLLRPGSIDVEALGKIVGMPVRTDKENGAIIAPGMLKSHYAPRAKVLINCNAPRPGAAWLGFGGNNVDTHGPTLNLSAKADLIEAAANLYAMLKALDGKGTDTICVTPIPETGLGFAINDRLRRAAAPKDEPTIATEA